MINAQELTAEKYAVLEKAVMQTEQGRLFLAEHARRHSVVGSDKVLRAIKDIRVAVSGKKSSTHVEFLRHELQEMISSIAQARREIAAIKPANDGENRIMEATEELDAIVTATERATNDILGTAEHLQEIAGKLRTSGTDTEVCDAIDNHATHIFMACSFQDITGQRTTKVVNVMHYLEQRVNAMINLWNVVDADETDDGFETEIEDQRPDAHLLQGPQQEGAGITQDEVNRMLGQGPVEDFAETTGSPPQDGVAEEIPEVPAADKKSNGHRAADGKSRAQDKIDSLFS